MTSARYGMRLEADHRHLECDGHLGQLCLLSQNAASAMPQPLNPQSALYEADCGIDVAGPKRSVAGDECRTAAFSEADIDSHRSEVTTNMAALRHIATVAERIPNGRPFAGSRRPVLG